jgi:hypothetical protein
MTHGHKNRKKCWMFSLLRAENFSCSLHVLYGGLGVSKLQIFMKKGKPNSAVNFYNFGHQNPGFVLGTASDVYLISCTLYCLQSIPEWMRANATLFCHLPLTFFFFFSFSSSAVFFFLQFLSIKTLDLDPASHEMLDPDPQHYYFLRHFL